MMEALFGWDPVFMTGLRLTAIWVLAYHLYHIYQKEIETAKQNAALSVVAKQAQLDSLMTQLNPHFLFNSLNSIKSLVIEKPETARRAIDLLSDILRTSLYQKDASDIPVQDELGLVRDYVELEKLRFEERLNMSVQMNENVNSFKVPALSIQLLVENAIKHGIGKRIKGGTIDLMISREGDQLKIIVENPGVFEEHNSEAGLGLKNLKERLLVQYKGEASLTLENQESDTVSATLLIPIE